MKRIFNSSYTRYFLFSQQNVQRSMSNSLQEYLKNETDLTVLDNGIKVATEDSGSPTATIGLFVNTGSKYETAANNGVANFFEHMLFKGTDKRTAAQLEAELESIGAKWNTVTSREETAFYATCLKEDVARCVEILSDVVQNAKFSDAVRIIFFFLQFGNMGQNI